MTSCFSHIPSTTHGLQQKSHSKRWPQFETQHPLTILNIFFPASIRRRLVFGRGFYSRGQKKVSVPFPLHGVQRCLPFPCRFRSINVLRLNDVSTFGETVNSVPFHYRLSPDVRSRPLFADSVTDSASVANCDTFNGG